MTDTKLFTPGRIGTMQVRNRIVLAGMDTGYGDEEGRSTPQLIAFHEECAKGGVGLIIVGNGNVSPEGKRLKRTIRIYDDSFIPGLRQLTDSVKKHGAKVAIQLAHGGRECSRAVTGLQPVAPSGIPSAYTSIAEAELPRTLNIDDIERLVEAFAQAALRAKRAGFDAVEIHGAHGYLIDQFLSPASNFRTDQYGGDIEARALFYQQIIRRCKQTVGADFPIIARLNWSDCAPGGLELEDSLQAAALLEAAGADAINITSGIHASRPYRIIPGMMVPEGVNVEAAAEFTKQLKIPVMAVGRIIEPKMARDIVDSGKADFVCMGRALLADHNWANLAQAGREDEIRRCIGCNEGCARSSIRLLPIFCTVNPTTGQEETFAKRLAVTQEQKTVAVVGGGPAGMEAARVAALRGFHVILFEQSEQLGGLVPLAAQATKRQGLLSIVRYYQTQLSLMNVDVRLGVRFNAAMAEALRPDAVIVATGGKFVLPPIPGADKRHVLPAHEALEHPEKAGERCLIIGGGFVGLEAAERLSELGKKVMLTEQYTLARNATRSDFIYYEDRLKELNVDVHTHTEALEIKDDGVLLEENHWQRLIVGLDSVILATGFQPDTALAEELRQVVPALYTAGDCVRPALIGNAVAGGAEAALSL